MILLTKKGDVMNREESILAYYLLLNEYHEMYLELSVPVLKQYTSKSIFSMFKKIKYDEVLKQTRDLLDQVSGCYSEIVVLIETYVEPIKPGEYLTTPIEIELARYNELFIEDIRNFETLLMAEVKKKTDPELVKPLMNEIMTNLINDYTERMVKKQFIDLSFNSLLIKYQENNNYTP